MPWINWRHRGIRIVRYYAKAVRALKELDGLDGSVPIGRHSEYGNGSGRHKGRATDRLADPDSRRRIGDRAGLRMNDLLGESDRQQNNQPQQRGANASSFHNFESSVPTAPGPGLACSN